MGVVQSTKARAWAVRKRMSAAPAMNRNTARKPTQLRAPYLARLRMLARAKNAKKSRKTANGKRKKYGGSESIRMLEKGGGRRDGQPQVRVGGFGCHASAGRAVE